MEDLQKILADFYSSIRCVELNLIERDSSTVSYSFPQDNDNSVVQVIDIPKLCDQTLKICAGGNEIDQFFFERKGHSHFVKLIDENYIIHVVGLSKGLNVGKYNALLSLVKNRITQG